MEISANLSESFFRVYGKSYGKKASLATRFGYWFFPRSSSGKYLEKALTSLTYAAAHFVQSEEKKIESKISRYFRDLSPNTSDSCSTVVFPIDSLASSSFDYLDQIRSCKNLFDECLHFFSAKEGVYWTKKEKIALLQELIYRSTQSQFSSYLKDPKKREKWEVISNATAEELVQDLIGLDRFSCIDLIRSLFLRRKGSYSLFGVLMRFVQMRHYSYIKENGSWKPSLNIDRGVIKKIHLAINQLDTLLSGELIYTALHEMGHAAANRGADSNRRIVIDLNIENKGNGLAGGTNVAFDEKRLQERKGLLSIIYEKLKPPAQVVYSDLDQREIAVISAAGPLASLSAGCFSVFVKGMLLRFVFNSDLLQRDFRNFLFATLFLYPDLRNFLYECGYCHCSYKQGDNGDFGLIRKHAKNYEKRALATLFSVCGIFMGIYGWALNQANPLTPSS